MTKKKSPSEYLKQHGHVGYSKHRVAKNEDRLATKYCFAATQQGRALDRKCREMLIKRLSTPMGGLPSATKRYGATEKHQKSLGRLLNLGVTAAMSVRVS